MTENVENMKTLILDIIEIKIVARTCLKKKKKKKKKKKMTIMSAKYDLGTLLHLFCDCDYYILSGTVDRKRNILTISPS